MTASGKSERVPAVCILLLSFLRAGSMYFYNPGPLYYYVFHFVLAAAVLWCAFRVFAKLKAGVPHRSGLTDAKYYLLCFVILLAVWLPFLLIKYPGAMSWDTWNMILEYRYHEISEQQSVFYTLCMGSFLNLFDRLGIADAGLFIFVTIHYLLYAAVFAHSLLVIRKLGVPKWYSVTAWIICVFSPYISGYVGVALKDALYAVLLLETMVVTAEFCSFPEISRYKLKVALLGSAAVLACLVRKNGEYVFTGLLIFYYINSFITRPKDGSKDTSPKSKLGIILAFSIIIYLLTTIVLRVVVSPYTGSPAEMYSVPFQQTARYVRDHPEDVTEEERIIIDNALVYDTLASRYDPRISDPVKAYCDGDHDKLQAYFEVWRHQFLRHPLTYVAATWEQNYYLFVPEAEVDDASYYLNAHNGYELGIERTISDERTDMYNTSPERKAVQMRLYDYLMILHRLPVINMLWNISIYFYILIIMTVILVRRRKDITVFLIPLITVFGVTLAPVMHGHPRYLFPLIYSIPLLVAFFISQGSSCPDKSAS